MDTLDRTPRRAWAVWGLGVGAYTVAVFQRSSLSVAGILAEHRFHTGAAALSLFAVLQLGVYAAMQIPVGALLDRLGSRRMVAIGATVMAAGQLTLAFAGTVPTAIVARVLVGTGDAMTFISVLRLVGLWFAPRQAPLVTQLTGFVGQFGQIAAAYPLVTALHSWGWTRSYAAAAGLSVLVVLLVGVALADHPPGQRPPAPAAFAEVRLGLRDAWRHPGTRIGMWTHFSSQFSGNTFAVLWGYPFLVDGEGLSATAASLLLTTMVIVGMLVGPVLGRLTGLWPLRRSIPVLAIVVSSAAAWALVLAWPGRAPLGILVLLVVVLGSNGPGSMVGFDYARSYNPPARMGTATGIVNVGGFAASVTTILLIGVVLQLMRPAGASTDGLDAFRVAFAVQYAVWLFGLSGLLRNRALLRRDLAESGVLLDPFPRAVVRRVRSRR